MDTDKKYRIIRLAVSGFMRLKALDITPKRNVNKLVGKNKQGKTSALKAIQAAIGGAKHFPVQPVHAGSDKAEIICILGDDKPELLVKRIIYENGKTALEIKSADGYQAPSPQAILDGLYSKFAFDPQRFLLMDEKQQLETVRALVGLDFTEQDRERKAAYDERTAVNRTVKTLTAKVGSVVVADDTPDEEVSIADLMKQRDAMAQANRHYDAAHDELARLESVVSQVEAEIAAKRLELLRLEAALATSNDQIASQKAMLESLEYQDNTAITEQIANAQQINQAVAAKKRREEAAAELESAKAESDALTARIAEIDADKQAAMENAQWPVPGLSFGEDGLLYNGVPFSQASDAEAMRVSFAMSAAMAPNLKVVLLRYASLLDPEHAKIIHEMAEEMDMQTFEEIVGEETDGASILIEDGEVVNAIEETIEEKKIEAPPTDEPNF